MLIAAPMAFRRVQQCEASYTRRIAMTVGSMTTLAVVALFAAPVLAQQAPSPKSPTGGSPVLPVPDEPFGGIVGRKASESKPDFPTGVTAPKGAPNILLIMSDDTGFGATSTFGGPIPTPNFNRMARSGLKYNMFHTTALCS